MVDFMTVAHQMFFTQPLAWTRWALGLGGEKETVTLGWQGYDAGVQLATATVDSLYRSPLFGQAVARSLDSLLRWQQVNQALARAPWTGVWQLGGLPIAADIQAVHTEVSALGEDSALPSLESTVRIP